MIKQILGKLPRKSSSKSSSVDSNGIDQSLNSSNLNSMTFGNPVYVSNSVDTFSSNNGAHFNMKNVPMYWNQSNGNGGERNGVNLGLVGYDLLPSFRDVSSSERLNLFVRKLSMCSVVFDFGDSLKNLREKDVKRQTLLELVDHLSTMNSKFNEAMMLEITKMVAANLFRTLPGPNREMSNLPSDVFEPEDEEPGMEPSWPHLQIVYELLLRFVASQEIDAKVAKRYINHSFVLRLLELFDSEDQREREYLKTILHRIYGKFMVHRPFIRKAISNIFYQFIFESEKHNGIAELLEILGSIINGFALPLKEEHKLFLVRVLIPLHKPKCMSMYHQQLLYCITQFVEKDVKLVEVVIRGLLKYWPVTNSSKEVMFLGELEEVLESAQVSEFQRCVVPLFHQIGRCLNSSHFQVAERALFLWNSDHIRNLILHNSHVILPIIFPYLERNSYSHWNQAVQSLSLNVRKLFSDADPELFDECLIKFEEDELKEEQLQERREATWKRLEEVANSKYVVNEAVLVSRFPIALAISSSLLSTFPS